VDGDGGSVSNYRIEMRCPCQRIQLKDCFSYRPTSLPTNQPRDYIFQLPEGDDRVNNPSDIQWTIDGTQYNASAEIAQELRLPSSVSTGENVEVCVRWYSGGRCYKICKRICFVNPYDDCEDKWWWYPTSDDGVTFTFEASDDIQVENWKVHTLGGQSLSSAGKDQKVDFSYNDLTGSGEIEEGDPVYMTITYIEEGCRKICCRKIVPLLPDCGKTEINFSFIGNQDQVVEDLYDYRFAVNYSGEFLEVKKWKYFLLSQPDELYEAFENRPEVTLPRMNGTPEGSIYRVCVIVIINNCEYVICKDICLTNPYECFPEESNSPNVVCNDGTYEISSDVDVAYWTDYSGRVLNNFNGLSEINYSWDGPQGQRYIYCYYYEYGDTGGGAHDVDTEQCWLRVCCIPLPDCDPCYDDCCDGASRDWLTPIISDLLRACSIDQGGGDPSEDILDGKITQGELNGECHYAVVRYPGGLPDPTLTQYDIYDCFGNKVDEISGYNITRFDHFHNVWTCEDGLLEGCEKECDYEEIALSFKVILNPDNGALPTDRFGDVIKSGYYKEVVKDMNDNMIFNNMPYRFCMELDFLGGRGSEISQKYYRVVNRVTARNNLEADAQAAVGNGNPYKWYDNKINFYLNKPSGGWGICSFPEDHSIILQAAEARWQVYLHEIGHFFDLCHTQGCPCGSCDPAQSGECHTVPGDDEIDDTLPDLACWDEDNISINSFNRTYDNLNQSQKVAVDRTFGNVMSYHHFSRMYITPDQQDRWQMAIEDFPTRKAVVYECGEGCGSNDPCDNDVSLFCETLENYTSNTHVSQFSNWSTVSSSVPSCRIRFENNNQYVGIAVSNGQDCGNEFTIPQNTPDDTVEKLSYRVWVPSGSGLQTQILGNQANDFISMNFQDDGGDEKINLSVTDKFFTDDNGEPFVMADYPLDAWFEIELVLDKSTTDLWVYLNRNLFIKVNNSGFSEFQKLFLDSALTPTGEARIDDICIYGCNEIECEEIIIDHPNPFSYTPNGIGSDDYLFTLNDIEEARGAVDIRWCIDGFEEISSGDDRSVVIPIPTPRKYRLCVKFIIPGTEGGSDKCYKICWDVCIDDPYDDGCADIEILPFNNSNGLGYEFTLNENASDITWTVHDEAGRDIGIGGTASGNSYSVNLDYESFSGRVVCVTVKYYDPSTGCYKTCCKCFCIEDPYDRDDCSSLNGHYIGNGSQPYLYNFEIDGNFSVNSWLVHGEAISERINSSSSSIDIDLQSLGFRNGDRVCVTVTYYDATSKCYRTCCYCFCLSNPLNDNCDLLTPTYIGSPSDPLSYRLNADLPSSSSDLEWTIHTSNGNRTIVSQANNVIVDFSDYGFSAGEEVCVSIRYYDPNSRCYRVCCICFCLSNPYDFNNCQDIDVDYQGASSSSLSYQLSAPSSATQISWTVHDEVGTAITDGVSQSSTTARTIDVDFDYSRFPSGKIICVTVRYYDTASQCWKVCCRCFSIRNPFSCSDIEHSFSGNQINLNADVSGSDYAWYVDGGNEEISSTGNFSIDVDDPVWGGQGKRTICLFYYDTISKCWSLCCKEICLQSGSVDCSNFNLTKGNGVINIADQNDLTVVKTVMTTPAGGTQDLSNSTTVVDVSDYGTYVICRTYEDLCDEEIECCKEICIVPDLNCAPIFAMQNSSNEFSYTFSHDIVGRDYLWDFGDGNTSMSSSSTVSHTYASQGAYQACLTVTNECGETCKECTDVTAGSVATLDVTEVCGRVGDVVAVDILVRNFQNYDGGTVPIRIDSPIAEFVGVELGPGVSGLLEEGYNAERDVLTIFWASPTRTVSLDDGATWATIQLRILNDDFNKTSLTLLEASNSLDALLLTSDGNNVKYDKLDGEICLASDINLAGVVLTVNNRFIPNTELLLLDKGVEVDRKLSNEDGEYNFIVDPRDYIIEPIKTEQPNDRASIADFRLILDHALERRIIENNPYAIVAADINRDNRISISDFNILLKLYLDPNFDFDFEPWRFVPRDYIFPNPTEPFEPLFPEVIEIKDLNKDRSDVDFIGIYVSDVNGSVSDINLGEDDDPKSKDCLEIEIQDVQLEQGAAYEVALEAKNFNQLTGFTIDLNFDTDALSFDEYLTTDLTQDYENGSAELIAEGIIRYFWIPSSAESLEDGQTIASFKLTSKVGEGNLSDYLSKSDVTSFNTYLDVVFDEDCIDYTFIAAQNTSVEDPFGRPDIIQIFDPVPNPFTQQTTISLHVKQADKYTFTFYSPDGKMLHARQLNMNSGIHEVVLSDEDLKYYRGVVIGKAESQQGGQIFRMVRIE